MPVVQPPAANGRFYLGDHTVLQSILMLIIDTIAGVLGGVLLLRFWTQVVHVRPPHALGQFMYQLTDWMVKPMRRLLPGVGGYDWASLVGALLVIVVAVTIDLALVSAFNLNLLVIYSLLRLVTWIVYGFIGLLIIEAVFSWVNPHAPLAPFIQALNYPLLRPLRRVVPLIGGIDLSPLVALIALQIVLRVVTALLASLI